MDKRYRQVFTLEGDTRRLRERVGRFSEQFDAAPVVAALGHLQLALDELHQAGVVFEARDRHDRADGLCGRCGDPKPVGQSCGCFDNGCQ